MRSIRVVSEERAGHQHRYRLHQERLDEVRFWLAALDQFWSRHLGRLADGEVLTAEPPRLLRCRWSGAFGDTVVAFELTPAGGGTRLRVTHRGWADEQRHQRDGFDQGWLDKLSKDLPRLFAGRHL
jgi:hypothetical protein